MKRLLLLVIAFIVYGSLYPWQFQWWRSSENPLDVVMRGWPAHFDRFVLRDVAINVLLYMPLGLAAFLAGARRHSRVLAAAAAVLLGVGVSTAMEVAQVYVPSRVPSLLDVITNSVGTLAGVLASVALQARIERLMLRPRHLASAAALLLGCWGVCQLYPFFPALTQTHLRHSLAALADVSLLSVPGVWADGAEWFAALLALRAVLGRGRWWWPAGALLVLAIRLVVATRNMTPDEAGGAVMATLLWAAIPERFKLRACVYSMAAALVLRELAPFHFSTQAHSFSWIPFVATFESERQSAVVILARKAFDYGVMVWLLRKGGMDYVRAGLSVAVGLFGFELLQVYLPGRTPESTDAVLAGLMAVGLWLSDDQAEGRRQDSRPSAQNAS